MKKLIFVLVFMFIFILPVSASYPDELYNVPWSASDNYVVIQKGTDLYAIATSVPIIQGNYNGSQVIAISSSNSTATIKVYKANTSKTGWLSHNAWAQWSGVGYHYIYDGSITWKSSEVINSNVSLFPVAHFQLQLTPMQLLEREMGKAILAMVGSISVVFSMVLPIGLVILSILLAIRLVPRIITYFRV